MICSYCKKNHAVIFITRIVDNVQKHEGLCISCAKKLNIEPISKIIEQTGMTDADVEQLNEQMGSFFENLNSDNPENPTEISDENNQNGNQLMNFLNKAFLSKENVDSQPREPEENSEDNQNNSSDVKTQTKKNNKKKKYLTMYGINLTDLAKEQKIDRIIGRYKEVGRVIQILNRRTKNNPVLVGEPGVGKTAIAEGLAVRIANRQVPVKLFNTEIYQVDLTALVAGTQFRGQFESRMKGLIDEARALGNIILVIDELHNIMGAGEAEGALNAANILKPALAKGEVQVIGATTLKEYKKIEKDAALERRFQPVMVEEPSVEETIEILKGIKDYYEKYHTVKISDEVAEAAAVLSERYITDRFLPDKAIDVLDEAGSKANLRNEGLVELATLKEKLARIREEKEDAVLADSIEDYQKAANLKVNECNLLEKIKDIEEKYKDYSLTVEDVASVIEAWTGVPVQRLTEVETEKLINLEERLHKRVVGQDKAVSALAKAIRRNRAGFRKKHKPSSFIFVGPTGVGKTELVKALAIELFESEEALIRMDMSEYMEKHTVSKMIGSPPGYIGYDEGGQLTDKVRRKPYSVILLDEIEKAHPDVFNMLLQIFDDGRLTDSHGRVVNFENTIIVMTSNAGTTLKSKGIGFTNDEYSALTNSVTDVLKETFRPEFLNRLDDIIIFTDLSRDELRKIVELMLDDVRTDVGAKNMKIEFTEALKDFLIDKGYDPRFGARPMRRTIQSFVEDELSERFLKGEFNEGCTIRVDYIDNSIVMSTQE